MAQAFYCRICNQSYGATLRGKSCPVCGEELIHGRVPASKTTRRANQGAGVGRAVWDHIIKKDPCAYCSISLPPKEITIDHIVPKALGGSKGSWTNRTASCRPCNARKAHMPLLFFLLEERGIDLSHFKDEDGNWPIPEHIEHEDVHDDSRGTLAPMDPRRLLAKMTSEES